MHLNAGCLRNIGKSLKNAEKIFQNITYINEQKIRYLELSVTI